MGFWGFGVLGFRGFASQWVAERNARILIDHGANRQRIVDLADIDAQDRRTTARDHTPGRRRQHVPPIDDGVDRLKHQCARFRQRRPGHAADQRCTSDRNRTTGR